MKTIKFSKVRDVHAPTRAHDTDAGIDFFIPEDFEPLTLAHGDDVVIPSGIKARGLEGHMLCAYDKSGVATKKGLIIGAKVVDESYQGEIHINLIKATKGVVTLEPGDKVAQFILIPVNYAQPFEIEIDDLFPEESERGEGWQGSTGTTA